MPQCLAANMISDNLSYLDIKGNGPLTLRVFQNSNPAFQTATTCFDLPTSASTSFSLPTASTSAFSLIASGSSVDLSNLRLVFSSDIAISTSSITLQMPVDQTGGTFSFAYDESEMKRFIHRAKLKSNLLIKVDSRSNPLGCAASAAETKARATLRDLITESEWRRYLTNGFIMVKGDSGRFYQIFSNGDRVRVYWKNEMTHKICIHTDNAVPPTDHVLNMKLLIQIDEALIWREGNVYSLQKACEHGQRYGT